LIIDLAKPTSNGQLSIFDVNGKELIAQHIKQSLITVNTAVLSCGIYFVRITDDSEVAGVIFIKH